jgi:hypothetical protein
MQAKTNAEALRNLTAANKGRIEKVTTEHQARLKQIQEDLDARASAISEGKESAVALPQASKRIRLSSRADEGNETEDDDGSTELSAADSSNSYTPPRGRDTVTEEIINEDVFFDASNRYAIPDLLMSRLGTVDDLPTATYHRGCSIADQERNNYYYDFSTRPWADKPSGRGVLGFYCEDHRFNGIDGSHGGEFTADAYRAAADFVEELKEMDFATIISPDFSTYHKWPLAMRIWSVYRSRWCARYWQEMGFTVIPSIQSLGPTGKETDTREFALDTLPVNIPAIAVQCRKTRKFTKDMAPFTKFLTLAVKTLKPEGVVIYGGEENQKYIHGSVPKGPKYIYLPSFVRLQNKQRGKVK